MAVYNGWLEGLEKPLDAMKRRVSTDAGDAAGKDVEVPFKPKEKYPGFLRNFKEYYVEYTENSSLHGVKYMAERKRTLFERICWFIILIISLYLCIGLIIQTYKKWQTSPVIVSFAQSPTPVWQIPFPAITVCPETKAKQSLYNFTHYYHMLIENPENVTQEELEKFQYMALVCDSHLYNEGNDTADFRAIDFLNEVAPTRFEMLWLCKWTNINETCDRLFTPILTEEGVCYTFNMLDRDDIYKNEVYHNKDFLNHKHDRNGWSLEDGYMPDAEKDTFPRRAMSSGATAGLNMLMRAYDYDLDYICKGPVQGFKILLHQPGEVPRMSSQYFRVPFNQEMIVSVKPDMMTTSDGLMNYDPKRRQCYFSWERSLRYYKNYTQQNCAVECLANYTLARCDCVAYHMPHNEATNICGSAKIPCLTEAREELLAAQVTTGLMNNDEDTGNGNEGDETLNCNCLPACTSLTYNAETSQADFNWQALFMAYKSNMTEFPGIMMSRMTIFFKEQQFITSTRNELYGITDFMANCGGLVGLFIGFSFLSLVEILHFVSLRLFCNIRRYGRHYWSGSPELVNNDAYLHTQ